MRSALLIFALLTAAPLRAQDAAPDSSGMSPGDWVRITAPALGLHEWRGRYVSAQVDSVTVRSEDDSTLRTLPLDKIQKFEMSRGSDPPGTGKLVGGAIGFVAGMAVGMARGDPSNDNPCGSLDTCSPGALRGGFYGALIGTVVGIGIGSLFEHRHWQNVPINPPQVTGMITRRGDPVIALTFRF